MAVDWMAVVKCLSVDGTELESRGDRVGSCGVRMCTDTSVAVCFICGSYR